MGKIFDILKKQRNKRAIRKSDEVRFYKMFSGLLKLNLPLSNFGDAENDFDMIKANIVIRAIINKEEMDKIIYETMLNTNLTKDDMKREVVEQIIDFPHIQLENQNIYIPFFNRYTNLIYTDEQEKMREVPYINLNKKYESFVVNPFETFGLDLFSSTFTQLVKIKESNTSIAYYHYEMNAIFIINNQGTLDNIIYIFDRKITHPHKSNVIDRVTKAVEAYYDCDLMSFVNTLYEEGLISYSTYRKINKAL